MHKLLLIDGNSILFRFYYAIGNEAYKFFIKYILKYLKIFNANYILIAFDSKKNKRKLLYPRYKANRNKIDDNIIQQQQLVRDKCDQYNIVYLMEEGYEADDIIASYAKYYENKLDKIIIMSSDKDMINIMSEKIQIFDIIKNRIITLKDLYFKFHIDKPEKMRILQSIAGDSSDNIPGAYGIGIKNAAKIVMMYEEEITLDHIYADIGSKINGRIAKLLLESKENVYLSYKLVDLNTKVRINLTLKEINISLLTLD